MPNDIRQKIMNLFKTYTSLSGENLRSRFMGAELDQVIKDLLKEGYLTRKIGAIPEKGYVYTRTGKLIQILKAEQIIFENTNPIPSNKKEIEMKTEPKKTETIRNVISNSQTKIALFTDGKLLIRCPLGDVELSNGKARQLYALLNARFAESQ